ncbi:unnamed protein product [Calypogeia fissa]
MAPSNGSRSKPKELPKECFNRKNLLAAHERGRLAAEQELQRNGKQKSENSGLGGSAESDKSSPSISLSSQPLSSLKEIFLSQLEIDKRHHGRVLFGTLCVRPYKSSPSVIISVLADKSGKAVSLSILNLPFSLSGQDIESRFPSGQKAAIKEPCLRVCEDGKVVVRVENPADLVFVDDGNKEVLGVDSVSVDEILEGVLKELDDIRAEGNKLFAEQKWKEAIAQYRKCIIRGSAILVEGEQNEKINLRLLLAYSNRSEVWLQISDYKNALDDANKALEFDPNHQKSISRRDRAWQGFGKMQQPASKPKVPVEDTNAADKALASKSKLKDVTPREPSASKGKSTAKPNPPPSDVSTGNGKDSKPVSPSTTAESAPVDSKKKPVASSVTITKPIDAESKNALVAVDGSATSTSEGKATTQLKSVSPPTPPDTESKIQVAVVDTSATSTSKVTAAAEVKSVSPPPPKDTESSSSKVKATITELKSESPPPPKDVESSTSKVKPTTELKSESPPPPKDTESSTSKVKATVELKSVSPPPAKDTESSTSKVKATTELKSVSPPPAKDTESKNIVVAVDTSATSTAKVKATTKLKSASPPPRKAAKAKRIETKDNPPAASVTSKKGKKLSSPNADPPTANSGPPTANADQARIAKGKLATSKIVPAADDSGSQSSDSDSDSENNSPTFEGSKVEKPCDADDDYTVIERNPSNANGARGDSPLPPGLPDSKSTFRSSTEPQKEMAAAVSTSDAAVDIELPPFAAWIDSIRSSADVLLSQGDWPDAVKLYNRVTGFALPQKNRDKVIQTLFLAYSHRSEAWIWTGDFEKSLRDADSAIKIVDTHPKSVVGYEGKHLLNEVRRGRAFHGLGEYEKACLVFHDALKKYPYDKSINDLLNKSRIGLGQSQKGIYDLDEWFVNRCSGPPPPCSDFVGPVEIRRVLGKGRGLFVTKDVEAGDLLLVSNPLLVVRRKLNSEDDEDYGHITTKWRRSRPGADPVELHDFVKRLGRLGTDKELYKLYSLTGGNPEDEIEVPHMSLFSPGAQHAKPLQGLDSLKISEDDLQKLQRISRIVTRNAMESGLNPLDERDEAITVGVWALPSFMNHSCVPNCHMIDIGDAMFVRASRNIQQGEELTRAYFDVYQNGIDRYKLCAEWSFVCNCDRCILEKSLIDQKILPAHEYRALVESAREESLRRQQNNGREKSLSVLLPNPQPALLQLRKFADWCDTLLDQAEGLGSKEKAWIGASHLEAYISRFHGSRDRNQFILGLENLLEFMTNTAILAIGHTPGSALERAAVLLAQVEDMYGRSSQTYRRIETRVLDLYHTTFGALSKEVLFTMSRLIISK